MLVLPNMHSRQVLTRSAASLARAWAWAWAWAWMWACSSMLGMEDIEEPRVRVRVKLLTVGERGVGSAASEVRRACRLPNAVGAAPLAVAVAVAVAVAALGPPKARERVWVGDSARGGPGLLSNSTVLAMWAKSSWAMMMRTSRGYSRSISGSGPSWALPGVSGAACSGYGWPSDASVLL